MALRNLVADEAVTDEAVTALAPVFAAVRARASSGVSAMWGAVADGILASAISRGTTYLSVKGTCCLWYKTQERPDIGGEGYCSTCDTRDPVSQVPRYAADLERRAATPAEG